jgi:hypothetical protein
MRGDLRNSRLKAGVSDVVLVPFLAGLGELVVDLQRSTIGYRRACKNVRQLTDASMRSTLHKKRLAAVKKRDENLWSGEAAAPAPGSVNACGTETQKQYRNKLSASI